MSAADFHTNGRDGMASNEQVPPASQECSDDAAPASEALDPPDLSYAGFTWTEGGIIAGACILIAAILLVSSLTSPCCAPSTHAEMMRQASARLSYLVLWALSTIPIFWACVYLRPQKMGWGPVLGGHLLLIVAIALAVDYGQNVSHVGILALWPEPDSSPPALHPLEVITSLDFLNDLVPCLILLIIGLGRYEHLRSRARRAEAERLKREAEQLRTQLTAARLEALRMQINPHFLFNTLHTVASMAGTHPDGVRRATARLSEMLRYALSTSDQQEVPLAEELDVLESYLDIQKLRLEERLVTHIDIDPGVRRALVPTLLLQPLAENAVKHGFEGSDHPGHLVVRARKEDRDLVLQVADNGAGLSSDAQPANAASQSAQSDEEHGLQNIAQRLDGLYGDAASLQFARSDEGGLSVVIRLPFHTRETESNLRVSAIPTE